MEGLFYVFRYFLFAALFFSAGQGNCNISTILLPEEHPIKPVLDTLFSQNRATRDIKSMKKAGFIKPYPRKFTHVIVTQHPQVEGYIFKLYLDAQKYFKKQTELEHWVNRVNGAELIRNYIYENDLTHLFKVPRKWIYQLPDFPAPPSEFLKKDYILVAEDMDLVSEKENSELWRSNKVDEALLYHLFCLIDAIGLHDCASIHNIPFSKDGKIAFIDTESYNEWPINFKKLNPQLSDTMGSYWNQLIKSGPNP